MGLRVRWLVTGPFQQNSYLLTCDQTKEAILVDPGDEADRLAQLVEQEGARPVAIWNTHAHIDHVGAAAALQDRYGIPLHLGEGDRMWVEALPMQAAMFGLQGVRAPRIDAAIEEGQEIAFGEIRGRALATPGHTEGGFSFYFEADQALITGDTLFDGGVGRTDLPGGSAQVLERSIRERLFTLPDEVTFYSGHGGPGKIGRERRMNPFFGEQTTGGFGWG